jgi:hypothetical protein
MVIKNDMHTIAEKACMSGNEAALMKRTNLVLSGSCERVC